MSLRADFEGGKFLRVRHPSSLGFYMGGRNPSITAYSPGSTAKGVLTDDLNFGAPDVAPSNGWYFLRKQTISTSDDRVLRVNCVDFESNQLNLTDVTAQGSRATCQRVSQ